MEFAMKTVPVREAAGMVLAHDMTQIIPGKYKGSRFKKGHILTEEDIPVLLDMGKENLYVLDLDEGVVHEDDAAMRIATAGAGAGVSLTASCEGKVEIVADIDGLLKVDREMLLTLNSNDEIMFATLHSNRLVKKGQVVGGTRIIPLVVEENIVFHAEEILKRGTLISVHPLKQLKVGVVTTGSEVFSGRIKDAFTPVLRKKFAALGSEVVLNVLASDNEDYIVAAITDMIAKGMEMIAVTGGMSVDPDDRTPAAIRRAGANIVTYGTPMLPGAMFLLAYINDIPVIGLPGCVMYNEVSVFDVIVPRLLAGERPTRAEIKELAHGGLCENCKVCHFPNCGFGNV
jgi:molybdopterin biosynthesis enzyme